MRGLGPMRTLVDIGELETIVDEARQIVREA
jgi:hypothetical protein